MTTTVIHTEEVKATKRRAFWVRVGRFLGMTALLACLGYWIGYAMESSFIASLKALPYGVLSAMGISLVAGWVPIGFYYEGHRFRWVYIVGFYLATLVAALFIGLSVAAAQM